MAMPASRLNTLYENAEAASLLDASWVLRSYASPQGAKLSSTIRDALKVEGFWDDEKFSELRTLLTISKTYSRALIAPMSGPDFWEGHFAKLNETFQSVMNYLPEQAVKAIQQVILVGGETVHKITELHCAETMKQILTVEGRVLIVPERPKLGHLAKAWVAHNEMGDRVHVLSDMADIRARLFDDYDLVLLPGSPSHYIFRPNFDIYLRALLLSGLSKRITFISPSWAVYKGDEDFAQKLVPGLSLKRIPELVTIADKSETVQVNNDEPDLALRNRKLCVQIWGFRAF